MPVSNWFDSAETALAAYADLELGALTADQNITALEAQKWPDELIDIFTGKYNKVLQRYTDDESSADAGVDTGFSVTVFGQGPGENVNKVNIAFRGTSGLSDFVPTDADILGSGAGYDQIVAMYNWWQRESNTPGEMVPQFDVDTLTIGSEPEGMGMDTMISIYRRGVGQMKFPRDKFVLCFLGMRIHIQNLLQLVILIPVWAGLRLLNLHLAVVTVMCR